MFKSIERSGGKCCKECITIMLEANVSGIEKVKLLIIGKEMKPKCFKENKSLPDDYRSNKKASMTSSLFSEWFKFWYKNKTKKLKSFTIRE